MITTEEKNTKITVDLKNESETEILSWKQLVKKNLLGIVTVTATVSLSLFVTSVLLVWYNFQQNKSLNNKQLEVQELGDNIRYYDEVLTMSARMATTTGDQKWLTRYNDFVPTLDENIKNFKELVSEEDEEYEVYVQTIEENNTKLIELETEAFDLVQKGQKQAAMSLVLSNQYDEYKRIYSQNLDISFEKVRTILNEDIAKSNQDFISSLSISGISFILLIVSWLGVIVLIRGYIEERDQIQEDLLNTQKELINTNENLESKLEKRTAKLKESEQLIKQENETLQNEVGNILEVVSAAEEGDLTVSSPVGSGLTGLVADTLNRLLEELSRIINIVLHTVIDVNENSNQLEKLAVETADRVQKQVDSLAKIQNLMVETNQLSQENLERNQKTYQAVLNTESAVNLGVININKMNHGIIALNTETDQLIKRLEILEDFVQIAAAVSREQKKVAAKIKVLGLNASMIAERAEAEQDPQQFAVFAQEFGTIASQVNEIASITGESLLTLKQRTDRMQTVVSGFNQDIQSINDLIFEFTESVNQNSDVFDQIKFEIQQLTAFEQQLNEYSMAIANASQTTLNGVEEITDLAKETENKTIVTLEKSNMMGKSTYKLVEIIKFFKVN